MSEWVNRDTGTLVGISGNSGSVQSVGELTPGKIHWKRGNKS
jgi:hypothetical protein